MLSTEMVKASQFVGAIVLFGGALFSLLIWAPVTRAPHPALRRGVMLGAVLLLLFGAADLLRLARVAADQPLAVVGPGFVGDVAAGTRYGRMLLLRAGLAAAVLVYAGLRGERLREGVPAAAGFGALLSFAYAGHSGMAPGPFLADLAHLLAVSAWAGGLGGLAAAPWSLGAAILGPVIRRFSRLAVAAVAVLAATGLYLAGQRIYGPGALVESEYGQALLVKVLLFAGLLTLAAVNRFALGGKSRAATWLQGLIWAEVVAMLFALGFAADLTAQSPVSEEPVRVTVLLREEGFEPAALELPLGRRVLLTVRNETGSRSGLVIREMEHRLFRGPGAVRHREMLTFAPPADRLWVEAAPGKQAVVEFTPLTEGDFAWDDGAGHGLRGVVRVRSGR